MEDGQEKGPKEYIMIFPFMAKGHVIPLLDLTSALSSLGLHVTIVTTPLNSSFLRESLPPEANPNVDFIVLPFPRYPSLPDNCESTDQLPSADLMPHFFHATELLQDPFRQLLHRLSNSNSLPLCVVSDFFLGWTLDACSRFHVPRVVFHGMSVFSMVICKSFPKTRAHHTREKIFHLPGTPPSLLLSHVDIPHGHRENDSPDDPFMSHVLGNAKADDASWGILVNSFSELDGNYVSYLEAHYVNGGRAWMVGPLCLRRPAAISSHPCLEWLDKQPANSVLYVSFGTQAHVTEEQMEEVIKGLEMSGREFILAARTHISAPPVRGLVVDGWVPQREVLVNKSTGGILSHCGWNSVLESLTAGVPILAWPMIAEQTLNAKFVAEELGAGLRVGDWIGRLVRREEICELVKELMGGERGELARKKAKALAKMAVAAVDKGGSSDIGLTKWVEEIRRVAKERPRPE